MPATARRIEMWPITRLKPYERNARTHSREQVRQIVASIKEFGFTNPLLADGADGILAGHGRLAAAKDMGLTEVPVIVLDHLSAEQRRAYILADNQLALNAGWDAELLQMEVTALSLVDFDLNLLGFSPDELTAALGGEFGAVDELEEEPDQGANRDIALAIVLSPEELGTWRKAKAEIGYSTDKAALLKLVDDLLEEAGK